MQMLCMIVSKPILEDIMFALTTPILTFYWNENEHVVKILPFHLKNMHP